MYIHYVHVHGQIEARTIVFTTIHFVYISTSITVARLITKIRRWDSASTNNFQFIYLLIHVVFLCSYCIEILYKVTGFWQQEILQTFLKLLKNRLVYLQYSIVSIWPKYLAYNIHTITLNLQYLKVLISLRFLLLQMVNKVSSIYVGANS